MVLLAALAGCSSGTETPETAPVTGRVLDGGDPIPNASVTFMPTGGRPSTGMTDNDGNFELRYTVSTDGALIGTHNVSISIGGPPPPPAADGPSSPSGSRPPASKVLAPREVQWSEPVEVVDGDNEFVFDVADAE